jgi:hypothetical protein
MSEYIFEIQPVRFFGRVEVGFQSFAQQFAALLQNDFKFFDTG